jgi:putative transposase
MCEVLKYKLVVGRERKRHVQQSLRYRDKNGQNRGGKRAGAGRPPKGERSSERHERRQTLKKHEAVHVVLRAAAVIGMLRKREIYRSVRRALLSTFTRDDFRVVHLSVQGTHIHLLVEANDRLALALGMKVFGISAAKHINAALPRDAEGKRRRGSVFPDRYHAQIIRTPRQARHSLAYVLNNWRKHGENKLVVAQDWPIDPFSSAPSFRGWRDIDATAIQWPATYEPLPMWEPKTWLLREGWKRYGLIGSREVPSRMESRKAFALAE